MFLLTDNNYYSQEANQQFMSASQYQDFVGTPAYIGCEARALARVRGEWEEKKSDSLSLGDFVHAWNQGILDQFKAERPEIISSKGPTKGQLKADYRHAELMLKTLEDCPLCMDKLQGQKEVIFTAEFAGCMWKVRLDTYNAERPHIAELKTTKSIIQHEWSDLSRTRVSFIEFYGYVMRAALYCEVVRRDTGERDWTDYYMVVVSKETVPDKAVISFKDKLRFDWELADIEKHMPRILAIKAGEITPNRCEICDYCRSTKVLSEPVSYELI